jgi:hypothetical protein
MYFILVWDDDILDYTVERALNGKRSIDFETYGEAQDYIIEARANEIASGQEPRLRRAEYRSSYRRGSKRG